MFKVSEVSEKSVSGVATTGNNNNTYPSGREAEQRLDVLDGL